MALHNQLGKQGEAFALDFLQRNGYEILRKNWRFGHMEIDIIAREDPDLIIFVEVKTRSTDFYGYPEMAVNKKKKNHLLKAANAYLEENESDDEIRFDVLSIILSGKQCKNIYHIKDAIIPKP